MDLGSQLFLSFLNHHLSAGKSADEAARQAKADAAVAHTVWLESPKKEEKKPA